ncbi:MAG TPA: hypothetical protein VMW48_02980, partial [Vicinamibacterales bacterium]|nr:hypothetical protein [Vicinamibacterales bacterium]
EPPVCVRFFLERTALPEAGTMNRTLMALAAYFKDVAVAEADAVGRLETWAGGVANHSSAGQPRKIHAEVRGVVRSIYGGDQYHFTCAFIRSLGIEGDRVACEHHRCAVVTPEGQRPAAPIKAHLADASRAAFHGIPLHIPVVVSGKDTAPYLVPRKVAVHCTPSTDEESRCASCPVARFGGNYEYEIPPDHAVLLEFVGVSNKSLNATLRRFLQVAGDCREHAIVITSTYNIEDVRLIPRVDPRENQDDVGHRYVVRRALYVGHDMETNKPYRITATTVPEPKTQYAVHLFNEAVPMTDDVVSFEMTPDLVRDLAVFRPAEGQSVWEKFDEIHADLEANVTRIWQRRLVAFAADAAYHSVLHFDFHGQRVRRGWVEVFILGDSGQGKTELVTCLREWYGCGEYLTGEDAGRTGLTYSIQPNERRWFLAWGVIPLNDGRLVILDEFSGLPADEFEKMSGLRSSGVLHVHKVITAQTMARVRVIYMSNPSSGRSLGTYDYGAKALQELIPKAEDIRRLDLALAVKSGEVPSTAINRLSLPVVAHRYTSDLCRAVVLWAWSRKPDQVEWTAAATRSCLDAAGAMADRYWPDPPLVEPADQRLKIARLAVSAAARTFSASEDGSTVIVEPRHVEFAVRLMDECYRVPGLRYDRLSRELRRRNLVDPDREEEIRRGFEQLPHWFDLAEQLISANVFTRSDLVDQVGYSGDEATEVIRFLARNRLIAKRSRGYVKEPFFIEWLHARVDDGRPAGGGEADDYGDDEPAQTDLPF